MKLSATKNTDSYRNNQASYFKSENHIIVLIKVCLSLELISWTVTQAVSKK